MPNDNRLELQNLPSVDKLLKSPEMLVLSEDYGVELVTYAIRKSIEHFRAEIIKGNTSPDIKELIDHSRHRIVSIGGASLKSVINATGIIIHTNLGRIPFGEKLLEESYDVLKGYSNLEFDLEKGKRGQREKHVSDVLQYLCNAEDAIVVNNNAAAVLLILNTLAKGKEVVVSRGELIEIGGSFRIPEIMAASDCTMAEVGTTNKTKVNDYERAINPNTAMLFKTHTSNYVIKGFTQDVKLPELVKLGEKHKIPVVYDIGSGLIRKVNEKSIEKEPDVRGALKSGIDLICFRGDKLLGGPQSGIIVGKKAYIKILKKAPMMRALRLGKESLALLHKACSYYLKDEELFNKNMLFYTLKRKKESIKAAALSLQTLLSDLGVKTLLVSSKGQYGGGTMPDAQIDSFSLMLDLGDSKHMGKRIYHQLLIQNTPILCNLISGKIYIDMLCVQNDDIKPMAKLIASACKAFDL
jgi:L-seryl-tRNA(Ser) seleniumtransferase